MDSKKQRDNDEVDCREIARRDRPACLQMDGEAPSCSTWLQEHFTPSDANVDPEGKGEAGTMGIATQR